MVKMVGLLFETLQVIMNEASLFAASGFLVLGISDLGIDLIWMILAARMRWRRGLPEPAAEAGLSTEGALAVFVPAWDEGTVIGDMVRHATVAFGDADYRLYVGCYPNDPATLAALRDVIHPRVIPVVGSVPGPTSKADCLNRLWDRMVADEAAGIM